MYRNSFRQSAQVIKENFDERPHHTWGGGRFFTGIIKCDIYQSGALQSDATVALSCRYWAPNHPFCCIHSSDDFQCFSMGQPDNPLKLPIPVTDLDPIKNIIAWDHLSQPPQTASWTVQPFLHSSPVSPTQRQTDTQIMLGVTWVAINCGLKTTQAVRQ